MKMTVVRKYKEWKKTCYDLDSNFEFSDEKIANLFKEREDFVTKFKSPHYILGYKDDGKESLIKHPFFEMNEEELQEARKAISEFELKENEQPHL